MISTYQIFPEQRLRIETITGEFTFEALGKTAKKILADPLFHVTHDCIVDMRQASSKMSKIELLGFADIMGHSEIFGETSKWAFIAIDPLVIELTESFSNRLDLGQSMQVFKTIQAAADFIQNPKILKHLID
jgi:glycine cleavage system protein P-like pyridoxal-binding family